MESSQHRIDVAILGSGAMSQLTRAALAEIAGTRVSRVISARAFPGGDDAFVDADVVAVCSANGLHVEHAMAAVAAGKHVVVEKPLTLDVTAGQRLLEEAARRGVWVSVISQRRFEPAVVATKHAVDSGVLGRPVLGECLVRWQRGESYFTDRPWRGTLELDGGVLFNQAVHVIDLLRWLFGPVAVASGFVTTRTHHITAPDTAVGSLRFSSGAVGAVTATLSAHDPSPAELNLVFEHGTIRLADDRVVEWSVPGMDAPDAEAGVGSGRDNPAAIGALGHRRQWERIIADLRAGTEPEVRGRDALGTAAVIAALHESSARDGASVTLDIP